MPCARWMRQLKNGRSEIEKLYAYTCFPIRDSSQMRRLIGLAWKPTNAAVLIARWERIERAANCVAGKLEI